MDARTVQSTAESGGGAGYDGHKRRKRCKTHVAVDTLGLRLAIYLAPTDAQERAQVATLKQAVQAVTSHTVEVAFVDQGSTGAQVEADTASHGIQLEVVKLPAAKRRFMLLLRRWVVACSCAWMAKFRRLARDDARLPQTVAALQFCRPCLLDGAAHHPAAGPKLLTVSRRAA